MREDKFFSWAPTPATYQEQYIPSFEETYPRGGLSFLRDAELDQKIINAIPYKQSMGAPCSINYVGHSIVEVHRSILGKGLKRLWNIHWKRYSLQRTRHSVLVLGREEYPRLSLLIDRDNILINYREPTKEMIESEERFKQAESTFVRTRDKAALDGLFIHKEEKK